MEIFDARTKAYVRRLLLARLRILMKNGFYGMLLMHMRFALDEACGTAATDGERIYFAPSFLDALADGELDFVMTHEVMHCVLKHCLRKEDRDRDIFNIACDIVVNSNILLEHGNDIAAITLKKFGTSMHTAPDGCEGHRYTAEQVYDMFVSRGGGARKAASARGEAASGGRNGQGGRNGRRRSSGCRWDDHSRWGTIDDAALGDTWTKRFADACKAISVRDPSGTRGLLPMFAKRLLKELTSPKVDWKSVLNDFVQQEINDYTFAPPDARFGESPFFLPSFSDCGEYAENILFMIDTSGSMSDDMVAAAFSEIKGALDCFDGKLRGSLGFFDSAVTEPRPFADVGELKRIEPVGGGGTDFGVVFEYVRRHMQTPPACIIVMTDGYAPFPPEKAAGGIPVLWLIVNDVVTPPWGKTARIED